MVQDSTYYVKACYFLFSTRISFKIFNCFLNTNSQHCPPELTANYQQRHLVAKQEKPGKKLPLNFCLRSISFILIGFFNMLKNLMTWDWWLYFSSERNHAMDLYCLKNPSSSAGFESANPDPIASMLPLNHRRHTWSPYCKLYDTKNSSISMEWDTK
jgi:hypothetical protein